MRILKIYPDTDHPKRFNYAINFGVWDVIKGDRDSLESFSSNLNNYDVVFLPQAKRWAGHEKLLSKIKNHKVKKVLFDNDSYNRSFTADFYKGIDYIFYRDLDKRGKKPVTKSSLHKWSVDTEKLTPMYGGKGIAFNCSIGAYPLRQAIAKFMPHKKVAGDQYIWNIQKSAAAIHVDSPVVKAVCAKALEFAACGTQIISNRTKNMELYYPDELIVYFDSLQDLRKIVEDFRADVSVQKKLREITVQKHDNKIRAKEIINILNRNL